MDEPPCAPPRRSWPLRFARPSCQSQRPRAICPIGHSPDGIVWPPATSRGRSPIRYESARGASKRPEKARRARSISGLKWPAPDEAGQTEPVGAGRAPDSRDCTPSELRCLAAREKDRRAAMRLLAIANALEGMTRAETARLAGMERQALRDAVPVSYTHLTLPTTERV